MKARVKATGEIWEFSQTNEAIFESAFRGYLYGAEELEFLKPSVFTPDYWARLEHQAAIAAMQGMCANPQDCNMSWDWMAECAAKGAHTLVEKLKEREE